MPRYICKPIDLPLFPRSELFYHRYMLQVTDRWGAMRIARHGLYGLRKVTNEYKAIHLPSSRATSTKDIG